MSEGDLGAIRSACKGIYQLFGQLPDVLESAWVAEALGDREEAKRVIDEVPVKHPFEIRYAKVGAVDWEPCRTVLDASAKRTEPRKSWG